MRTPEASRRRFRIICKSLFEADEQTRTAGRREIGFDALVRRDEGEQDRGVTGRDLAAISQTGISATTSSDSASSSTSERSPLLSLVA
jgi:hypothetical protein